MVVAALVTAALPTLAMLVSAAVFSTTFLTGRVHRERGRALDRALDIDDRLAEVRRRSRTDRDVIALGPEDLSEQATVLRRTLADKLDLVVLVMNAVIVLGVIALAVLFGVDGHVALSEPDGWALIAFPTTAALVVGVGAFDVLNARRQLRQRVSDTVLGRTALAGDALRRAARAKSIRMKAILLIEARQHGRQALRLSGGIVSLPEAMLAYVDLLEAQEVEPADRAAYLYARASEGLKRAIEQGPPTASMWAAWSFAAERLGHADMAVRGWRKAAAIATRELSAETISRATDGGDESAANFTWRDADDDASSWFFAPSASVLAAALEVLPATEPSAWFTAATMAARGEGAEVAAAIATILDRLLAEEQDWRIAAQLALGIKSAARKGSEPAATVERYLAHDGPIADRRLQTFEKVLASMETISGIFDKGRERSERISERYEIKRRQYEESCALLDQETNSLEEIWVRVVRGDSPSEDREVSWALAMAEFRTSDAGRKLHQLELASDERTRTRLQRRPDDLSSVEDSDEDKARAWSDWQVRQRSFRDAIRQLSERRTELQRVQEGEMSADMDRSRFDDEVRATLFRAYELRLTLEF
jgi:hypothetical protein